MEIIWKDIQGFKGYQVSNTGQVRTHEKISYTKKHGERHWANRILKFKGSPYPTGYRVDLWKDGRPHTMLVARLTAFTFYGVPLNDHLLTVNHKDGNRLNNILDNLELISLSDNINHGFDNNLYSTSKNTTVINKVSGEKSEFRSMSKASHYMGYYDGYVSEKLKKGISENNIYKWQLTNCD